MLDLIDTKGKKDIKSMTLEEVTAEMTALGEKSFRAKQLYDWLHVKLAESFDDMSTLSKDLRQKLKENYSLTALQVAGERISAIDGTRKYLFRLEDGNVIESVWMQYHHGNSVCISSQVGCRMGCRFCAFYSGWHWSEIYVLLRCWTRSTVSRPLQESGCPIS